MSLKKIALYWIPPILMMGAIFFLSAQEKIAISNTYTINFIFFKSLHIIEYAVLHFLMYRALRGTYPTKNSRRLILIAGIITLIYAISDELHQTIVPSRNGTVRDVFIDFIGILLSIGYTEKYQRYLRPIL